MRIILRGVPVLCVMAVSASATLFFPNLLYFHPLQGRVNLKIFFLAPTADDGFLLAGNDNYTEYMIKTDQQGRKLWDYVPKTLDYPGFTSTALITREGKYLLAGTQKVRHDSTTYNWYQIIRVTALNVAGTLEWERTYVDSINNIPVCMAQARDGGVLIAGHAQPSQSPATRCLFMAIDSSGVLRYRKCYGYVNDIQQICGIEPTADNNFLVLAYRSNPNMAWIMKVTPAGDTLWTKLIPYLTANRLNAIRRTNDGNFICGGFTVDYAGKSDFWVVKMDPNATALWYKTYQCRGIDTVKSIDTMAGGGYCFAGSSGNHCVLMRISDRGDSLWSADVGYPTPCLPSAISVLPSGRCAIAGTTGTNGFLTLFESEAKSLKYPQFDNWEVIDTTNSGLVTNHVVILAIDSADRPWVNVRDDGSTLANIQYRDAGQWKLYPKWPGQQITDISVAPSGHVWIAGDDGICRYDGHSGVTFALPSNRHAYCVTSLNDSTAYAGYMDGFYQFNGNSFSPEFTTMSVYDIAVDRASSIWFVPDFGIGVKSASTVTLYNAKNLPFPDFTATKVKIDASGAVWTATSIGLLRYANGQWSKFDSSNTALPTSDITAFGFDASGTVFAACDKGFTNISKKNNILYDYYNSPLPSNSIHCIEFDKAGNMWIGTDAGLVCVHSSLVAAKRPFSRNRAVTRSAPFRLVSTFHGPMSGCRRTAGSYDILGRTFKNAEEPPSGNRGASRILIGNK